MEFMKHIRTLDLGHGRKAVEMECLNCGVFTAVYVRGGLLAGTTDTPDIDHPRDIADRFLEEDSAAALYSHTINDNLVDHLSTEDHQHYSAAIFTEYQVECAHCGIYSALYDRSALVGTTDDPVGEVWDMADSYAEEFGFDVEPEEPESSEDVDPEEF